MNKYDKRHLRNLARYEAQIKRLFDAAMTDAASLAMFVDDLGERPFAWADYPLARMQVDKLIEQLNDDVNAAIVNGVRSEWTLSNDKNNELCRMVFGANASKLPKGMLRRYYNNNESAREAFIARKANGLQLSDNVWRYTDQFKAEIEMALDIGIRAGRNADAISREVRQCLVYPDKLFRRVRDEHGQLQLSKAAKAFHPGQGVYRSSYMNARRLAATETNIAYRTADYLRWQQLDFVVGIEIHLSNNHNCKGVPDGAYFDICDELKGRYPKDFKFTGWHPHCRCWAETILKTEEEMAEDDARIMAGEEPSDGSVNEVRDLPDNFREWMADNQERIERAKSLPYFIRDNALLVDNIISPPKVTKTEQSSATESAKWFNSGEQADNALRKQAGEFWRSLNSDEKQLLAEYTGDGYAEINRAMRGLQVSDPTAEDKAEDLRWLLNTSRMDKPIWVQRVETIEGLGRFGIANPMSASLADMNALVGKTFDNESFASACVVKGAAENQDVDFGILFDIKVPKGASAVYVEPFSTYGNGDGINWDGFSKQKTIGSEAELLINAGQKFKVKRVKREDDIWHITLEIIAS